MKDYNKNWSLFIFISCLMHSLLFWSAYPSKNPLSLSKSSPRTRAEQETVLEARFYEKTVKTPKKVVKKEIQPKKNPDPIVKKEHIARKAQVAQKKRKMTASKSKPSKSFMADFSNRQSHDQIPDELKTFFKSLSEEINRHKHYPLLSKRLNESGTVVVSFEVYSGGKVQNINLKKLCDFDRLNKSAYKVVASLSNLAPLPDEYNKVRVTFPLSYVL